MEKFNLYSLVLLASLAAAACRTSGNENGSKSYSSGGAPTKLFDAAQSKAIGKAMASHSAISHVSNPPIHGVTYGPARIQCEVPLDTQAKLNCDVLVAGSPVGRFDRRLEGELADALLANSAVDRVDNPASGIRLVGPALITCDQTLSDPLPNGFVGEGIWSCTL